MIKIKSMIMIINKNIVSIIIIIITIIIIISSSSIVSIVIQIECGYIYRLKSASNETAVNLS